jgi:PAS domain S-box-containing protein
VVREAEERLRIFVEQVQEYAIILLDPEGRVVTWNIGAQRLMQYEACEIVGKSKAQFYTPEDQAAGLSDQILDLARRNGWTEKKGWRVRKDGSRFMADLVLTALHDDRGQLRGFMNVTRDITTRKNEEEHLRRQEIVQRVYEERESIARNLHDGVLQSLYAVRLGLEHCRRVVAAQPQRIVPEIDARIEDIGLVIVEIREFMTGQDLYVPRTFELRKGLAELLQVHQVSESPMWRLHVPEHDDNAGLSHEEVKHILYIAREAISNSARHAAAHLCQVALVPLEEGLRVTIEDDGVGFTPRGALQRTGRGFSNMEARARQIGVTLDIVSAPGRGTRITIDIPRRKNYVSS